MRIYSSQRAIVDPVETRGDGYSPPSGTAAGDGARNIGALLVSGGFITAEQAEQVARAQRASGGRFGDTAVALGFASQDAVDAVLASQFDFAVASPAASQLDPSLIAARGRRDRASELIRSLRANLSHVLEDWPGEMPAVTVASVTGAVGRRLIASNLAIASAQAGVRTLLIDADMRHPALHQLFNTPDQAGLSTFLAGRQTRPELHRIAAIPGLTFHPAGPVPPNPAELLARLAGALPTLKAAASADMILINPPPLDVAEDLYVIAAAAPAVLMVARSHFTRAKELTAAATKLGLAGATIVGSVLNVA